ncbi:hypothetical protein COO91_11153 (plasmid) [Nostoc flagelliforme CCNUN1]|uniref:Uncharacterized protein n=1 Tax=Nostoc flagelliforme CCNUN1 TaxID=2038116 RepID=A0A2K8TB54_9NOSO|nr:hypothetical protein COO91_11153 [Nostoc flagelliforme CCNUN1]
MRLPCAVDGLVVTLIVHALNRDSVNYLSFQSPTASDRLFFSHPHSLSHLSMRKF